MKLKFEVGDKVKINREITIKELSEDAWNGCQSATLEFIKQYFDSDKMFTVSRISTMENLELKEFNEVFVNYRLFNVVPLKKMTVSEIEKELGYPIKIIKED